MRILITWGSKMGGTEGIARTLGEALTDAGHDVILGAAGARRDLAGIDAVVVGGALYANRWHGDARRFVLRHQDELRRVPLWMFSSGPLDDSAERQTIAPPPRVQALMELVGALGHTTFGGRLAADAKGFPARAMARDHAGDWRNPERIRAWGRELAAALPTARPGVATEPPGYSLSRFVAHGVVGWAACALLLAALLAVTSTGAALTLHALGTPVVFAALAWHYFRPRGARGPLRTAAAWTAMVAVLDLLVVGSLFERQAVIAHRFAAVWLPLALVFVATLAVGGIMSTLPWPRPAPPSSSAQPGHA